MAVHEEAERNRRNSLRLSDIHRAVDKATSITPPRDQKPDHDQSYSDLGGYECYPNCQACKEDKCPKRRSGDSK